MHAMTNHSCDPNCEFTSSEGGRYIREFATRDIKEGEELTISYLEPDDLLKDAEERKDLLFESFGFECVCRRCLIDTLKEMQKEENQEQDEQDAQEQPKKKQKKTGK